MSTSRRAIVTRRRRSLFPDEPVPRGPSAPYVMRGAEIAGGLVCGEDVTREPLEAIPARPTDLTAVLERVLIPALERSPCLVGFSGGRDSSGVLAVAVHAARRHGLPLPIPVTNRFPGSVDVDESDWQESVVRYLGLEEWARLDITDELDIVGPVAGPFLRRFGVVWPPNSHFLIPHLANAEGGALVTGVGGDELFIPSARRAARLLAREVRPSHGDLRIVAATLAPRAYQTRRQRTKLPRLPWLRPVAAEAWVDAVADIHVPGSLWWGRTVIDDWWRSRERLGLVQSLAAAAGEGVLVQHPFMHPEFLQAVAGAFWRTGFPSRKAAMDLLFGGLLPEAIRERTDKAAFFQPFVHRHSRAFIASWDGGGVDTELVDVDGLRRTWEEPMVDARSYALLQSAWLASLKARPETLTDAGAARTINSKVDD